MDGEKDEKKKGKGQEKKAGYLIYDSELKNPTRQSSAAMQICIILALDHH